jgi:hypothetical protein
MDFLGDPEETELLQYIESLEARTALAQPEPEGLPPRVGHILRLAEIIREVDGNHCKGAAALAEAILSHPGSRWSPTIEPVPVAEDVPHEEILRLAAEEIGYEFTGQWFLTGGKGLTLETNPLELLNFAHAILARWSRPTIKPVPVAERLPGPEDCAPWPGEPDATHWAWAGKCVDGGWEWSQLSMLGLESNTLGRIIAGGGWTHWARWDALPVPGAEEG